MPATDILILEEQSLQAQELRGHLLHLGYRVVDVVSSRQEAIDKIKMSSPDILLMNIRFKGTVGDMHTGSLIREGAETPVVYIIDGSSQATIRRVGAAGTFGYIFKPFDRMQILATVETALVRHQLERKLEQSRQWLNTTLTSIGDGVIATDEQGLVRFINPKATEYTGLHHLDAVGNPLQDVFPLVREGSLEPVDIFGRGSRGSPKREFAGLLQRKDRTPLPVEANLTAIEDGKGRVYGMVLIFRDVTGQREAMHEIRRQANRAEALLQVASRLNTQLEIKTVLNAICKIANQTMNADGTAVILQGKQKEIFLDMAVEKRAPGVQDDPVPALEIPKEVFEKLLSVSSPVVLIQDPHVMETLLPRRLFGMSDVRTLALAALFRGEDLIGCLLSAFAGNVKTLPGDEMTLLKGLANQASSAIQNAELFEQVRTGRERQRKLAKSLVDIQEAERRHIARELHDHFGQLLTGLQFMLENAKQRAVEGGRTDLEEIQATVVDIIEQVREMSLNLRPGMLDDLGLVPTLQWHFERFSRQTGVEIDFRCDRVQGRFPSDIETAAYRIVQEALTNVARHAEVESVLVGLAVQQSSLWVEVVDHGCGFDASRVPERPSAGLGGMRERAELAGGYLLVRSLPGQGTQVVAALPIHEPQLERRKNVRKSRLDR